MFAYRVNINSNRVRGCHFMMQRICPVCDQVMKHAHYCSACRSWVKDPVYMNVTYYLNERHPEHETHCSYHNEDPNPVKNGTGKQKAAYKPAKPAVNTPRTTETADRKMTAKKTDAKTQNPVKKLVFLYVFIVVLFWIISLVGGLVNALIGIF